MMHSSVRPARTTRTGLTVLALLLIAFPATVAGLCLLPSPAALATPGPAEPVHSLVKIDGRSYEPQGRLYLPTIHLSFEPRLGQYLLALLQPDVMMVPKDEVAPADLSGEERRTLSQRLLAESQTIAQIVALREAGYAVRLGNPEVEVVGTFAGTTAAESLQPGDVLLSVNGESVSVAAEVVSIVHGCVTGEPVTLRVRREHRSMVLTLPALRGPLDTEGPVLGLMAVTTGLDYRAPVSIAIDPGAVSGGPSAGLMYGLGVYNALSTEDITRGHRIAGTGTLRLSGAVGPVGAIGLKVRAAEDAGAEYFLVAAEDAPAARTAARKLEVIAVHTFEEALTLLREIDAEPSGPGVVPAGTDTTLACFTGR